MRNAGSRRAATLPLLVALATWMHSADAVEPVPLPAPEPEPSTSSAADDSWSSALLAPLRPFGVESWADVVHFDPWTGSVGFTFDDQETRVTSPGSPTARYSSRLWSELFTIRNDNFYVIDPALLTGTIALGVTFEQTQQRAIDAHTSNHDTVANYAFDATALPDSPYNVNVFATRTQNTYVQASGSTTRSDIAYRGIAFHLRETSILRDREILPYFTANMQATQQTDRTTTTSAGQTFRQDDRRDQVQLDFQNGTETSDLRFAYQFTRLDNFAYAPGSYDSQSANAVYSIDFGPTLNWRSDSRMNYYKRTGKTPDSDLTTLDFNEYLTIDHNVDLSSSYNYQVTRQETEVGNVTTQSAVAQLVQQLYGNLSMTYSVTGLYTSLPNGTISSAGVAISGNYSHSLPWEGQLYASAGVGYLVTDSNVPGGAVQVVDAPYSVPAVIGAGSRILLADRNIQTPTIVVIVIKGATRVPAVLNVDYTIDVEGDRTYIVPLASSALIQPNDTLNVSYTFLVAGESKFRTDSRSASISADWHWFGASYSHDESDQTPISGTDPTLLVDERRDSGSLYVLGEWEDWTAKASATVTRYDSTRLAYRERRFDQYVTYVPYYNMQLTLSGYQTRTQYELPAHTTTNNSARADFQWTTGGWITSAYAGWRSYSDTEQPTETIAEGGVNMRRTWAKLDLNVAAGYQHRTRGGVQSTNGIVHIAAVRRF